MQPATKPGHQQRHPLEQFPPNNALALASVDLYGAVGSAPYAKEVGLSAIALGYTLRPTMIALDKSTNTSRICIDHSNLLSLSIQAEAMDKKKLPTC